MAVVGAVVTGRIVAGVADVVADDVADEDIGVEVVLFTQLRCPDFTQSTE